LSSSSIGLRGVSVAQKLTAAGSPAAGFFSPPYIPTGSAGGGFLFAQIYANPITESVELLPVALYNDDVEFDNTLFSIWRFGYVY